MIYGVSGAWGENIFRQELLSVMQERVGPNQYGSERQESGEQKAERLVRKGLAELGWAEREMARRAKGDPGKVKLARILREQTIMTLAWIAHRLQMGSWTYVSNLLREK